MHKILIPIFVLILLPIRGWAEESIVHAVDGRSDIILVRDGWKLGLQKENGSVIVPCEYEEILPIEGSSSHFVISLGGKYGVIDEYGTVLLPVRYSYIIPKLFGNKMLIQQGGGKISDAVAELSIPDNDPYFLHIGSGEKETQARYMEINAVDWAPYIRRFATNGQWGLADIRPNVSMIFPSYSMVSACPDNKRYILMGYSFGGVSAFNIYDTQEETFMLSMEKKVQYSSIYLLKGGYFLVNGYLRKFDDPETNIGITVFSYVSDLNGNYFLGKIGKTVALVEKSSGKAVPEDKGITHYVINDKTGDFFLKEGGSWVLYADGKRWSALKGNIDFMGAYPLVINGDEATILIDEEPGYKTAKNLFAIGKDGKSIFYLNAESDLATIEYPSRTEKIIEPKCSGFQLYYANQDYLIIKKDNGSGERAGLLDLSTGKIIVPVKHHDIRTLYGDYYISSGDSTYLRRISDTTFAMPIVSLSYNDYTHKPFCWISNSSEADAFALYSMEKDSLLTDFRYTGIDLAKYPGRMMMLGDDYIPFIQNGKKGIMDTGGREIFPAAYDQLLFTFTEGFCIVAEDTKFGCINPYTGVVLPCIYEDVGRYVYGKCIVKKDGLWGIADEKGEIIMPYKYKSIEDYFEDLDWLRKDHFTNGLAYGVLDDAANPATVEWFDNNGNVICTGTATVPLVKSVIPEGLWDY